MNKETIVKDLAAHWGNLQQQFAANHDLQDTAAALLVASWTITTTKN